MSFITVAIDAGEIAAAKEALGKLFDNAGLAATLKAALQKAVQPAEQRLEQLTPIGPTGNLKRAVSSKVVSYPKNGGAVGLIGYRQSQRERGTEIAGPGSVRLGKERGFHQWWIEFGTKERQIKKIADKAYTRKAHVRRMKSGVVANVSQHQVSGQGAMIASSWNKRGQFGINADGTPDKPYAFFKKGKKGQALRLDPVPAGGRAGVSPVQTAWNQTRGQMAEILQRELSLSLDAALAKVARSSTGTITGAIIQAGG